jgi:heme exporter protein C
MYTIYVASPTEIYLGELYRIFYVHVPVSWICYLTFGASLISSILFLAKRDLRFDMIAELTALLGLVYGALAIITGSIWANAAWGIYWNWDPRETTTLILWIAYLGYVSLRMSIGNPEKRATIVAIYNILAFSTIPLSYMSVRLWISLHPLIATTTQLSITREMVETLILSTAAGTLIYAYLFRMFYRVREYEERIDNLVVGGQVE